MAWSSVEQERLEAAAKVGDARTCLDALSKGADPNRGALGVTPLMIAALSSQPSAVEALLPFSDASLKEKADRNAALALAAGAGCVRCVELLSRVSNALDADHRGATALMRAAECGRVEVVEFLLSLPDAAEQASSRDNEGATALAAAAGAGSVRCVELLSRVSDALGADERGTTALMRAAESGRVKVVEFLLSLPDAREQALALDWEGDAALARSYFHPPCAMLLAPLSDFEARNKRGMTALDWIDAYGDKDLSLRLREAKALAEGVELAGACASAAGVGKGLRI